MNTYHHTVTPCVANCHHSHPLTNHRQPTTALPPNLA